MTEPTNVKSILDDDKKKRKLNEKEKVKRYLPLFMWAISIAVLLTGFCCSVASLNISLKVLSLLP